MKITALSRRLALLTSLVFSIFVGRESAQGQTYALTNIFNIAPGTGNIPASGTTTDRGMGYDAISNVLYVATTAPTLGAFNGSTGSYLGAVSMTGVGGGTTFSLDTIGVAADGAVYGINLCTSSSSNNKLYRWANYQATATVAYAGNALSNGTSLSFTSGRIGDTLAVTGSGTNTLILAGVMGKAYFILFSTTDGLNFTPTIINASAGLSLATTVFGITLYTNNTFLVKPTSSSSATVYLVQYPTNFASQAVVTGTVLASTATLGTAFNSTTLLNYNSSLNVLAAAQTGTTGSTPVEIVNGTVGGGFSILYATNATNAGAPVANGNATGGVVLGISTTTNLYVLDSGNALYAYKILSTPPVAPSITTAPVGGTYYNSDTLTVTAIGSAPFSYTWLTSSTTNSASFVAIPGATTNSYTITSGTNYYEVVVSNSVGSVTSAPVLVTIVAPITNSAVSTLWTVAAGQSGYSFLSSSDGYERGIGYDTNTSNVVVSTTSALYVLNGNTGAVIGTLNTNGVSFTGVLPNASIDQVGIADDGAVYAGNLTTSGGFYLGRWPTPTTNATATVAYSGDPANGNSINARFGDSMAVRGSGIGTQIALSSQNSTNVAILVTSDGLTFNSLFISISGVPAGFSQNGGLAFGVGNTLWGKKSGGDLFEISFDTNTLTGTMIFDYTLSTQIPSSLSGLGVDPVHNILAGVNLSDKNNDLQLFQLTGSSDAPVLFDQTFFASANSNPNGTSAVAVKYPRMYAIDANNGLVALTYGVPAATAPTISSQPGSQTNYAGNSAVFSVSASGSIPLYYQWRFNSNNITGATNQSFTITNLSATNGGYYDVVVHNIANSVTSAEALLVIVNPVVATNYVTNLYTIAPGSRTYLDSSSYSTRGLAFDTNYNYLFLAQLTGNIYALNATNGTNVGQLNTIGLPTGGINGYVVDQLGAADDGVIYGGNLADTSASNTFDIISWTPVDANPADDVPNYAYAPGDPGNGSGDRWGDDMAVRGAGVNTQIICGSYNGTNVVLFTTADGTTFTPTLLTCSDPNVSGGFAGLGIAFGASNTFWAKGGHFYNLRLMSYDTNAHTCTVLQTYAAGTQTPNDFVGLSYDVAGNVLGGVNLNDSPNDFQLYQPTGTSNAPILFNQEFFASQNANSQDNGASVLKGGYGFALDVNNGLVALTYSAPPTLLGPLGSFSITGATRVAGPGTTITFATVSGHTYQVQVATSLVLQNWTNVGSPITATTTSTSYTDTTSTASQAAAYYRVVGN